MTDSVYEQLQRWRLLAVLRLENLEVAPQLSTALYEAGVHIQEYTLSNPGALDAIKQVRHAGLKDLTLGAGSVRSLEECQRAIDAGAQFIVTPVYIPEVIRFCNSRNIVCISGALTPTEILNTQVCGAPLVKVFPAHHFGPDYIKDLLAPMPDLKLVPTGGVGLENLSDFLQAGATAVGVGSAIIDKTALMQADWQGISEHAQKFVSLASGVKQ